MSAKYPSLEPATERPHTLALSKAEVVALVRYHTGMIKRVTKTVGAHLCDMRSKTLLASSRDTKAVINEGQKLVEAHFDRAKVLNDTLKS